jgi:ABC-2 type transport system permease protein
MMMWMSRRPPVLSKTLQIARREFAATVLTKGFIFGVLMTPFILLVVAAAVMLTQSQPGPRVQGRIAVIDQTEIVGPEVLHRFSIESLETERLDRIRRSQEAIGQAADRFGLDESRRSMAKGVAGGAVTNGMRAAADITVNVLPPETDPADVRDQLALSNPRAAGDQNADQWIALVIIGPEAIARDENGRYGSFEMFVAPRLDFQVEERISGRVGDAIVNARIASDPAFTAGSLDPYSVRAAVERPRPRVAVQTAHGEQQSVGELAFIIPAAFMILLMLSVFTAGQYLLTSTIEEKSSRVMEVLLSAVSPMELMTGKILGQMCVGLLILIVYSGLGVGSLIVFSIEHLVNPLSIVYLLLFFLVAFFLIASLMAAIGSAVNDLREAQTLMTPIMAAMIVPWLLWLPLSRNPNSTFATVLSFIPGVNPFVMVIRLAGAEPVPFWHVAGALVVAVLSVVVAAWGAAKIFRIGALMHGKPPNVGTLIRWVRMA